MQIYITIKGCILSLLKSMTFQVVNSC